MGFSFEENFKPVVAAIQALQAAVMPVLTTIQGQLTQIIAGEQTMALDISALTAAVTNETTVEQSAVTLIAGLAAQIQTLINNSGNTVDPAALQALVTQMTTSQTALAAAVAANTTAAPAPSPTPSASASTVKK